MRFQPSNAYSGYGAFGAAQESESYLIDGEVYVARPWAKSVVLRVTKDGYNTVENKNFDWYATRIRQGGSVTKLTKAELDRRLEAAKKKSAKSGIPKEWLGKGFLENTKAWATIIASDGQSVEVIEPAAGNRTIKASEGARFTNAIALLNKQWSEGLVKMLSASEARSSVVGEKMRSELLGKTLTDGKYTYVIGTDGSISIDKKKYTPGSSQYQIINCTGNPASTQPSRFLPPSAPGSGPR